MNYSRKTLPFLLLTLLTLLIMIPAAVFGEDVDVQEIAVTNTPVKGKILLEKQGLVLTGFEETDDGLGNTVHTPIYEDGWLEGAVFEVRAVEDIVGKEGTKWFSANDVAATITTSGNETDETPLLPLGHYYVTEVSAPAGYKFESTRYDVVLDSVDRYTPVVEIKVTAKNDFIPAQISLKKEKEIVVTSKNGDTVSSRLEHAAGEGFVFGLYNKDAIVYRNGTLPADALIATGITDAKGNLTFDGNYPHGEYYIQEISAPEGWKINPNQFPVSITDEHIKGNRVVYELEEPILDEIIQADLQIAKTDLTGSDYLPDTLIEVKDSKREVVCRDFTGANGYGPCFYAIPGDYTFREVLAPEGYELCITEFVFTVRPDGTVEQKTSVADDYTRFSVLKVDEQHEPLAGVEFGLYKENNTLCMTAVSDENGLAVFEKVPYGKYFIQEKTPLPGYLRDYTRVPITVDGTFINPAEPLATIENCPTEVLMQKVDDKGNALSGAEIGLFNANGKLVMTTVSDENGLIHFSHVPNGTYHVRELTPPDGYLLNHSPVTITIEDGYKNPEKPTAVIANQRKLLSFIKTDTAGNPLPGAEFCLINDKTGETVEIAIADENGKLCFTQFGYGEWTVRETVTPDGFCTMEDIQININDNWTTPDEMKLINVPNHYEFIKTDTSGNPLPGVQFRLEDADGNELGIYESGSDGIVHINGLKRGVYYIKEIETLEGFSVTGEVIKVSIDEKYMIPEQMKRLVNYTMIQTGVNMAVTGVSIAGACLIVLGGVIGIIRKKRMNANKQED